VADVAAAPLARAVVLSSNSPLSLGGLVVQRSGSSSNEVVDGGLQECTDEIAWVWNGVVGGEPIDDCGCGVVHRRLDFGLCEPHVLAMFEESEDQAFDR
jgi:hypothetical protein